MFKEPFDVVDLVEHADKRGVLHEVLRFKDQGVPGEGQLYVFTINPGERRGDHYHEAKREWFTCVSGQVTVLLEDRDGHQEKVELSSINPKIIYCGPFTTHALYNEQGEVATCLSYSSKQHDPDQPDTYSKIINYESVQSV